MRVREGKSVTAWRLHEARLWGSQPKRWQHCTPATIGTLKVARDTHTALREVKARPPDEVGPLRTARGIAHRYQAERKVTNCATNSGAQMMDVWDGMGILSLYV